MDTSWSDTKALLQNEYTAECLIDLLMFQPVPDFKVHACCFCDCLFKIVGNICIWKDQISIWGKIQTKCSCYLKQIE